MAAGFGPERWPSSFGWAPEPRCAAAGEPARVVSKGEASWARARELFLDLAELPTEERKSALEQLRRREPEMGAWVERLLANDAGPTGAVGRDADSDAEPGDPERLGPYEVLGPLGRGGMGTVYVAQRADGEFERRVAIKVLHPGTANAELVQRFLRERQTLAQLDHEYIAGLLDGGTSAEGEPYLVMELVEGEPAHIFAERLAQRQRLELFIRICRAVAHAHERGFVHRDLKPGNILVRSDGTPRLLDFGIARIRPGGPTAPETPHLEPLTRTGLRLFTPEYASPEQVRGEEVTYHSDQFSLGVLLYRFLTGRGPWGTTESLHVLERSICEDDPPRPSRWAAKTTLGRVSADLDAIVLQCLAKRPTDRYGSVVELIDDLQRCCDGLPIQARRTGVFGRLTRAVRRRPAYLAVAILLVFSAGVAWVAWRAARRAAGQAAGLRDSVQGRVSAALAQSGDGALKAAVEELDDALATLDKLPGELHLRLSVLTHKANLVNLMGAHRSGLELVDEAQALAATLDSVPPEVTAALLLSRTTSLQRVAPGERSRAAARAALEFTLEHIPIGTRERVDALLGWRSELYSEGRVEEAIDAAAEAVAEARLLGDGRSSALSQALNDYAVDLARVGRLAEAADGYAEALGILTWRHGERHPSVVKVSLNHGTALYRLARPDQAERALRRALEGARFNEFDAFAASALHFLGRIHHDRGEWDLGLAAAQEALDTRVRLELGIHVERTRCLVGLLRAGRGEVAAARELIEPVLRAHAPELLPAMEADAHHVLGVLLQDAGEPARGRTHLRRALQLKRTLLGPDHPDCLAISARI